MKKQYSVLILMLLLLLSTVLIPMAQDAPSPRNQGEEDTTAVQNKTSVEKEEILSFRSPVVKARISSRFGVRLHPILKVKKHHNGIDLAAPKGTKVFAAAAGKVVWAKADGGYGNKVVLIHDKGFKTVYAQLSRIEVREGQMVNSGDLIGLVGSSGISRGPHLHFELRKDDIPVNPETYISFPLK